MQLEDYELLITEQNSRKEKFMEYFRAIMRNAIDISSVVESFDLSFTVENAAGEQLDVIGSLVGVSRLLDYEPSYGDRIMDDEEFRLCIMLKIAKNEWDGTNEGMINAYKNVFGENVVEYQDNQSCNISLFFDRQLTTRMIEILRVGGYIIVPAGVSYEVNIQSDKTGIEMSIGTAVIGTEHVDCVIAT